MPPGWNSLCFQTRFHKLTFARDCPGHGVVSRLRSGGRTVHSEFCWLAKLWLEVAKFERMASLDLQRSVTKAGFGVDIRDVDWVRRSVISVFVLFFFFICLSRISMEWPIKTMCK